MKVWVLDKALNKIAMIPKFLSLTFDRAFNSQGSFELKLNANDRGATYISEGRIVYLDSKRTGVIQYVQGTKSNNKSGEIIIAKGYELKDKIASRITVPPSTSTTGYDEYTNQTSEYIVRQLFLKHIIEPENANRRLDIFNIAPYQGYGNQISFSTRYKNLADESYALLTADNLGLESNVDIELKTATLRIVAPTDRSIDQSINKRAIFALKIGTLKDIDKLIDNRAYKNYGYTGGQGEGAERAISEVFSTEEEPIGFSRNEVFIDARDIQDSSELEQRGLNRLAEFAGIISLDGTIRDIGTMTYDIGDFVTVIDGDIGITKQIVGVGHDYVDGSIVNKRVTFGVGNYNISQAIAKRLRDITNELTR